jgi:hypothetical protein
MRWPSGFFKRLALSESQTPSPEVRPAEYAAPASQLGAAGALWTRCRHALIRNPHQVRAGRARARDAPRHERARFTNRHGATTVSHLKGLANARGRKT